MNTEFYKFDGAGNDFVVIDNRDLHFDDNPDLVALLCHRRFGIGADGLMTLNTGREGFDFAMTYYNSDGLPGTMCGNGGRCIAAFAHMLGLGQQLHFEACDGSHEAEMLTWDGAIGLVRLGMREVKASEVQRMADGWFLDTGSPHFVKRVENLEAYDVVGEGRRLRNDATLFPEGANINFVEDMPDGRLMVRTFERGVEDETWACGTGVTAAALVSGNHRLCTRGGDFRVDFNADGQTFGNIRLTGPVSFNFKGLWTSSAK